MTADLAALGFSALSAVVALFQVALVCGAPWGHLTMGGRWPGTLPREGRVAAAISAVVMGLMGAVMLGLGGWIWDAPRWTGWVIAAYLVVGTGLHVITPSRAERRLWLPVIATLLVLALVVLFA